MNLVALALIGQALAFLVAATDVDPVATASLMIAFDALAIVGLAAQNTRGARIAAWAHGAAAVVVLGAVLAFGAGGSSWLWAAALLGAGRTVGYGIAGGMWKGAAALGAGLAIAMIVTGLVKESLVEPVASLVEPAAIVALIQSASCVACIVFLLRVRSDVGVVRSSMPGLRFVAIVLVCEAALGLLPQWVPSTAESPLAGVLRLRVLAMLGCLGAAGTVRAMLGELPRWALVGCTAVLVAAVGGAYNLEWGARLLTTTESVPGFSHSGEWLNRILTLRVLGYCIISAAAFVRGVQLPAAPRARLRWLMAALGIASLFVLVMDWRLRSAGLVPEELQRLNQLIELALLGSSLAFAALVAVCRRAVGAGALPIARQVSARA